MLAGPVVPLLHILYIYVTVKKHKQCIICLRLVMDAGTITNAWRRFSWYLMHLKNP